jgi:tetratricopeptide (TPR) repeat protein/cellulose synthase/poly-beta-1,6-N-acetylglucosamine synthase-like glycosyltransferase
VIVFTALVCLVYLIYRAVFTLNLSGPYAVFASLFLYVAEVYGVAVVLLYFLQIWDVREPPQQPVLEGRTVEVFVPTYNEDPDMLRTTLLACVRMDYPHKVYLCDDGGTEARCKDKDKGPAARERADKLKAICAELGVTYVTRPENRHAKAGNLNYAFEKTDGEFIIIFDADHVPEPNSITRLLGYFKDEKLAFVQTPHAFYNFESFQSQFNHRRRVYWEDGQLFYEVIQPGRNRWGCPIFAGSAAMFRRKALAEVGFIATETITEDMHTGLRMHSRGWRSMALSERMVAGQAAPDVTTFHTQRLRWGEGNLSIMAADNPLTTPGLTFPQRLCYLGSMIHWAGGLFKLPIYLTPLMMLFTGVPPVNQFTWTLFAVMVLYLFCSIFGVRWVSGGFYAFWNIELFTMAGFWTQVKGTMRAIFMRRFQKFGVTSKRGRQTNSLWPFLRPHVYFVALSITALLWGWCPVLFGISQDYFRPILASCWTVFHMSLACACLRRSLWPEERRYSYRHTLHVPVSYARTGLPSPSSRYRKNISPANTAAVAAGVGDRSEALGRGWGVSMDLSDAGLGLVTYEPLIEGSRIPFRIYAMGEMVECEGEVTRVREVVHGEGDSGKRRGYRCGVAFKDLVPTQTDIINRFCLHYAVPRLYHMYEAGRRFVPVALFRWVEHLIFQRRADKREPFRLPVVLSVCGGETPQVLYAATEDVGHDTLAVLLHTEILAGTEVGLFLATPLGPLEGRARVITTRTCIIAARPYFHTALEVTHFEGEGRTLFHELLTPGEKKQSLPVLAPEKTPRPVPVARPAARAALGAVPMLLLTVGIFWLGHGDDFFLRDLIASSGTVSPAADARLERVYAETVQQSNPTTDRLVLLAGALARTNRRAEADQVALMLAPRDRTNLDLQIAQANAYINARDYARARADYERLLAESKTRRLPAARQRELEMAYARSLFHSGDVDDAAKEFRKLIAAEPANMDLRYELAGALTNARRYDEAAAVYDGVTPDRKGRLLLASDFALAGKHEDAERQCDIVLKDNPDDPEAGLLKADILTFKRSNVQAEALYNRLRRINPGDPEIRSRLAFIPLGGHQFAEALALFQQLLDEGADKPELVRGYVDAASSAPTLSAAQRTTVLRLFEAARDDDAAQPSYLGRLAWVLTRLKEDDRSLVLLEKAVGLDAGNPDLTRQYIGALVAAKRWDTALPLLERQEPTVEVRSLLATIYLDKKQFDRAERECQAVLAEQPDNVPARQQLAGVLSGKGKHKEALDLLLDLARLAPDDPTVPVRLAEATLAAGDYQGAANRYAALLAASFEQPPLWEGFVNAAAGCKPFPETHAPLLRQIAGRAEKGEIKSAPILARIAWLLLPRGERERAAAAKLLERALAAGTKGPDETLELSGVLSAIGMHADARRLYLTLPSGRQDPYRLVELHAAVRDWKEAETQCWRILQRVPNDKKGRRLLADVWSWKGNFTDSLNLLGTLSKEMPDDAELPVRLAEVTLWSGDFLEARARYRALLAKSDDLKLWPGYLAAVAGAGVIAKTDADRANKMYERAVAADETGEQLQADAVFLARLAVVLAKTGDKARADRLLTKATHLEPREPEVRKTLARALAACGRLTAALKAVEGLKLEGDDRFLLVELYAGARDWVAAEKRCRDLATADPKDLRAKRWLADVLSWKGEYAAALTLFRQIADALPDDTEIAVRLAEVTLWMGDAAAARDRFRDLLSKSREQPRLWRGFVAAVAQEGPVNGDSEKVRRLYQRLSGEEETRLSGLRTDPVFMARLAAALRRAGEEAKAEALFAQVLETVPADAAVRIELGGVLAAAGRTADALKLYEGLKLEGQDRFRIVEAYAAARDWPKAERASRELLRADPKDLQAQRWLADLLSWKGDHAQALSLFQQLAAALAKDDAIKVRLAEETLRSGHHQEALALYRELLAPAVEQPALWTGFVTAAGNAAALGKADREMVRAVADRVRAAGENELPLKSDVIFLARLGRALQRAGDEMAATVLFADVMTMPPQEAARWIELGTVLASAGRTTDAQKLYQGLPLEGVNRFRLVELYAAARDWSKAEGLCRELLSRDAADLEAKRWLADILSWKRDYTASLALFAELEKALPADKELAVRQAEVTLWARDFPVALRRFRALLDAAPGDSRLARDFLAAAAGAPALDKDDVKRIAAVHEAVLKPDAADPSLATDPLFLARLALALQRTGDEQKAATLFAQVLQAPEPPADADRVELGGILTAAGRTAEALKLYHSVKLEGEDRFRLVELYATTRNWPKAEELCRELLRRDDNDLQAKRWLADVLSWRRSYGESLALFEELAAALPSDASVPVRQAEVTLWSGDAETALIQYRGLLDRTTDQPDLWDGFLQAAGAAPGLAKEDGRRVRRIHEATQAATAPATTRGPLFQARLALALQRVGEADAAKALFAAVLAQQPKDAEQRIQLAVVCVSAGRTDDALKLYADLPLEGVNRFRLVELYAAARNWSKAEALCRELLSKDPADLEAKRWLADVLSWKRDHATALALFTELEKALPADKELGVRQAEVTLWARDFPAALRRFRKLLDASPDNPRLARGFLAALVGAGNPSREDSQTVLRIHERVLGDAPRYAELRTQPLFLARLGAALTRCGEAEKGEKLLAQAYSLRPREAAGRVELGGVFVAAGKTDLALELYRGVSFEGEDRFRMVELYAAAQNWPEAEKLCRQMLQANADDLEAKRWLADVLAWKRDHAAALALLAELEKALPKDESVRARLAEVTLWSRDYAGALKRFRKLLLESPSDQPKLWPGYLEAVAGVLTVGPKDRELILKIHEGAMAEDADLERKRDPLFLARLGLALQRAGEQESAEKVFAQAWQNKPEDAAGRLQMGGVLAAAGRVAEAQTLYQGLKPEGENRFRLVELYATARNWAEAEKLCRQMVQANADDLEAQRWLADVLDWKRDHLRSLTWYEKLAKAIPDDRSIPVRMAEVTLASGDLDGALVRYRALLTAPREQPRLWAGYLQALAGADNVAREDAAVVKAIQEAALNDPAGEELRGSAAFLARLAGGVLLTGDKDKADPLFTRAIGRAAREFVPRYELAAALIAAGKTGEGRKLFKDAKPDGVNRFQLVELYAAVREWDEAARQCRVILEAEPEQRHARRWLADILSWKGEYAESLKLFRDLLRGEPDNLDFQVRVAEVTLWGRDYVHAVPLFEALPEDVFLRASVRRGFVNAAASAAIVAPPTKGVVSRTLWVAGRLQSDGGDDLSGDPAFLTRLAWVLERGDETAGAEKLLDRAVALKPQAPALRKELAGVLAALRKYQPALDLYKDLPLEIEDRCRLAEIHSGAGDFKAALEQCEEILRLKPGDKRGLRLKADVLSWNKDYAAALALLRQLAADDPADAALKARITEVTLWSGDYQAAAGRYETLLGSFEQRQLWAGFVDAVAGIEAPTEGQLRLARRILERIEKGETDHPLLLARLGWILHRTGDKEKAEQLFVRASRARLRDPRERRELAGMLAGVKRFADALRLYDGVPVTSEERYFLIDLHAAVQDFPPAIKLCREALAENGDRRTRRLLADLLSWNRDYKESLKLFGQLVEEAGTDREAARRLAEVTLWSGSADNALPRFRKLLADRFEQPDVWGGFLTTVALARRPAAEDAEMVGRIQQAVLTDARHKELAGSVHFLARLARAQQRVGDKDRACELLDQALALKTADPVGRRELAGALAAAERFDEARRQYDGLELDVNDRLRLLEIAVGAKDQDAAAKAIAELDALGADDAAVQRKLAEALNALKKHTEAMARLRKAKKIEPGDPTLDVDLALTTFWSGQYNQALEQLHQLVKTRGDDERLVWGYIDAAAVAEPFDAETHRKTVLSIYEKTMRGQPEPAQLRQLAWVLRRVKQTARGVPLLEKVLEGNPQDSQTRLDLANALEDLGRYDEANKHFQILLRKLKAAPK